MENVKIRIDLDEKRIRNMGKNFGKIYFLGAYFFPPFSVMMMSFVNALF